MVLAPLPMLNVMMSAPKLLLESIMACRNDPAPLSFVFVTTKVLGDGSGPKMRLHPPAMLPPGNDVSVTAYKFHVPLASVPVNVDKVLPYGPAGAGLGKVSGPVSTFVGL